MNRDDLVVGDRTAPSRLGEAVSDLDPLDGLDTHERSRQPGVEPAISTDVGAQSNRGTGGDDLDDTTERVPVLPGGIDLGDHGGTGGGVGAAYGVGVEALGVLGGRRRNVVGQGDGADAHNMADQPDAGALHQERLGQRPQ